MSQILYTTGIPAVPDATQRIGGCYCPIMGSTGVKGAACFEPFLVYSYRTQAPVNQRSVSGFLSFFQSTSED